MIVLIQRVSQARVEIDRQCIAHIENGILALIAIQPGDNSEVIQRGVNRVLNYRIFADHQGKMNLSLIDTQGGLLMVPQFTLLANTNKGNRPGFGNNVPPDVGEQCFNEAVAYARLQYPGTQHGQFGADMQVSLTNDGPVTFWLEV